MEREYILYVDSDSEQGESNVSDNNSVSGSASNSDTETHEFAPNGMLAINLEN